MVDLEQTVLDLQARVEALEQEVRSLKATGGAKGSAFSSTPKFIPVSIKREGDSLWYIPDKDNFDIHHPIAGDRLTGRFINLELVNSTYEDEETAVAVLHIRSEADNTVYKVRMNAALKPKSSVTLKSFLTAFEAVPDASRDLALKVYAGNKASTVMVTVLDPLTNRSFRTKKEEDTDTNELASQWRNTDYFIDLLQTAIAKINEKWQAPTRVPQPPQARTIVEDRILESPTTTQRSLPLPGASQTLVARLQNIGEQVSKGDRTFIRFDLVEDESGEVCHCFAWDNLAGKLAMRLYHPGTLVKAEGVFRQKNGQDFLEVTLLEPTILEPPQSVEDAIAEINVQLDRLGWSKAEGSAYLLKTYGRKTRAELTDEQVHEFLAYLKYQPTPAGVR